MDGSRIQRKKSPFSKIPGYVWMGSNKQRVSFTLSLLDSGKQLIDCQATNWIIFYTNAIRQLGKKRGALELSSDSCDLIVEIPIYI